MAKTKEETKAPKMPDIPTATPEQMLTRKAEIKLQTLGALTRRKREVEKELASLNTQEELILKDIDKLEADMMALTKAQKSEE